ncbi:MAG: FtsX-like permease family protein, partial [Candidatus Limnocylindrales bacterium]
LAPLVAAGAVQVLAVAGPLAGAGVELPVSVSGATLLAAALSGLVCVGVLVAPWVPTGRRISALRLAIDRERSHVAAQRFGIDIALLLVAGLALWQLRLYGSPVIRNAGGELGIDPLLVAGPAVAMAAVSLLAARALPRLAGIAEWILVRRRNLVPQLGAHDLARRPLRSIRSTLLIMLAAALTTFAVVYDATWLHSQADQAAYQAAADIRVVTPSYAKVEAPFLGPTYRAIAGVTAASPVLRQNVDIGGSLRTANLLALDAVRSPAMIGPGEPDTSAGIPFAALAAGRPALPGIELPGRPVRLEVNVDAALTSLTVEGFVGPGDEVVPAPQGLSVSALVVDGDGQVRRFDAAAPAAFEGASETLEIPLQSNPLAPADGAVDRLATPLHLISLEIQLTPALAITNTTGSLELRRVQVSDSPIGDSWTVVPFDPGAAGWSWLRQDASFETPYQPPAGQASLIRVDAGAPIQGDVYQDSPTVFRAAASPGASLVVGAIASSAFLAATGDRVGDSITGSINGDAIPFRIVGQADDVPSLDPGQPFLVVDGPTLNLADYFANGTSLPVSEWWLSVAPGDSSAVARQLAAPPLSATTIVSREAIQASLRGDPVALGVVGALLLGAISAVIFAGLGFLVSASASIEARAAEFGLLRAIGLTESQLVRWLAVEQGILLAVGISAGSVLGAAIAWVVLPAVSF